MRNEKKTWQLISVMLACIVLFGLTPLPASAGGGNIYDDPLTTFKDGYLTYGTFDWTDGAVLLECDTTAVGDIVVPSTVNELQVKDINYQAFMNCKWITSISLDLSMNTSYSDLYLSYCNSLAEVLVSPSMDELKSIDGVLYSHLGWGWDGRSYLVEYPSSKSGSTYIIPDGTTFITSEAFDNVKYLKAVYIPPSVTDIHYLAFGQVPFNTHIGSYNPYSIYDSITIYGEQGSVAETYANTEGIRFVEGQIPATTSDIKLSNLLVSKNADRYPDDLDTFVFDPDVFTYNLDAGTESSFRVTPAVPERATIKVNGTIVENKEIITINFENSTPTATVIISVISEDGTENTYTINVTRTLSAEESNIATLAALTISEGTLAPEFSSDMESYSVNVSNDVSSITVTPTVTDTGKATVKVNGTTVTSGNVSNPISLITGNNNISIVVTAENGITKTYSINVVRGTGASKLPAPQNVRWGENYSVIFDAVPEAEGSYRYVLYKDGEIFYQTTLTGNTQTLVSLTLARYEIDGDGVYKVGVASAAELRDSVIDSDYTYSPEITYTKPSFSLDAPTNLRAEKRSDGFYLLWDEPSNASDMIALSQTEGFDFGITYQLSIYRKINEQYHKFAGDMSLSGKNYQVDINRWDLRENETYVFAVRSLSGNLDKIFNSEESPYSKEFTLDGMIGNIKDALEELISDGKTSEEVYDALTQMEKAELALAMQASSDVSDNIKVLEDQYNVGKNITVDIKLEPDVNLDPGQISIIGAGFNADDGTDLSLNFSKPIGSNVIEESVYKHWVQFDITLDGARQTGDLDVPVQITMPVPAGVDVSKLVILHYHEGESIPEQIRPRINSDGTITFTITRFSIFVFADATQPINTGNNNNNNANNSSDYYYNNSTVTTPPTATSAAIEVTAEAALVATQKALKTAKDSGTASATVNFKNPGVISLDSLQAMVATAKMPLRVQADSMNGNIIDVRISFNPALAKTPLNLFASTVNAQAVTTKKLFEKWFSNKVTTLSLGQQGSFGMMVEIVAKIDLSGMDTKNLYFYSYNKTTNTYRRITNPVYWIDANGYLHFSTTYAGDIIISDGPLTRK